VWKSNSVSLLRTRKLVILHGDKRDRMDKWDSLGTIWYNSEVGKLREIYGSGWKLTLKLRVEVLQIAAAPAGTSIALRPCGFSVDWCQNF
jgi:hypothetical protein